MGSKNFIVSGSCPHRPTSRSGPAGALATALAISAHRRFGLTGEASPKGRSLSHSDGRAIRRNDHNWYVTEPPSGLSRRSESPPSAPPPPAPIFQLAPA